MRALTTILVILRMLFFLTKRSSKSMDKWTGLTVFITAMTICTSTSRNPWTAWCYYCLGCHISINNVTCTNWSERWLTRLLPSIVDDVFQHWSERDSLLMCIKKSNFYVNLFHTTYFRTRLKNVWNMLN